jgi:hypothetical protein
MDINKSKSSRYIILVVLLLVLGIVGYTLYYCMVADRNSTIGKTENGYRVDKAPINNRFPKLGQFEKCYWKADTIGKSSVGPSSYWMKGFVVLNNEEYKAFKTQYKWIEVENGWKPSLNAGVLNIKSLKWSFSTEFDNYIKTSDYVGKFYLDLEKGIVFFDVQK